MRSCEILPERWPQCLDRFSRGHMGYPVHVSISGALVNAVTTDGLPLIGVTTAGLSPAGFAELRITAGRPGGPFVDHVVPRPRRLWTAEWNDGVSGMLEIDSDDGSTTRVRVGPAEQLLPEGMVVDGVPPSR